MLEAVAGPGAGERERGPPPHGWPPHTTDYGPALVAAAQQQSALLYGSFNATGAYHVALQTVDSSTDYRTWRPTTLQIPLSLEYFHDAHMSEMAARWESRRRDYGGGRSGWHGGSHCLKARRGRQSRRLGRWRCQCTQCPRRLC